MKKTELFQIALAAAVLLPMHACEESAERETYYAPTEVVLQEAQISDPNYAVTLSAFYNGDDSGVKEAEFVVYDASTKDTLQIPAARWDNGVSSVTVSTLQKDHDYYFNYIITTPGGNTIKASSDGYCSLCAPYDFTFATQTTAGSKILIISFKGSASLVSSMSLILKNSAGELITDAPEVVCHEGQVKVLFKLDEWPQDLYTCALECTLPSGEKTTSPIEKFTTLPLPETLTLKTFESDGAGTWTLSAAYDGDDKTVTGGEIKVYDKGGSLIETLTPACNGRQAIATCSGHDYGKYTWTCSISLVDGSTLSAGPAAFTYAKPRAFATLDAPYAALVAAGISTSDEAGPFNFTYLAYDWEVSYLRAKTSSGYLINGSSRKGYICNVTPFTYGIKLIQMNLTQGDRLLTNYEFYAKTNAGDEWALVSAEQPTDNNKLFKCDLSGGDYHYFKFQSKGVKEIRFSGFSVDYFTEEAEEY